MVAEPDIGPLTWVKGEIDLALDRASATLDRPGAEGCDLKSARNHLHQVRGALSIVGLDGITRFSEAIEQLLAAVEEGRLPHSPQLGDAVRQSIAAVRRYLDDLADGRPDQPLKLLPAYRALAAARGQPDPAPSDLFFPDLSLRPPRREREPAPLADDVLAARLKAARLGFERGLLKWLKQDPKGLAEMRNSVAAIEMTQTTPAARAFWWVTLALLDAIDAGALPADDPSVRRLCGRIDTQIRKLLEGSRTVAERLMRDALYFVATAGPAGDHAECVRAAYRLADLIPPPSALGPPHPDEKPRPAQERPPMGPAVKEIQANLGIIEQALDAFFRDPSRNAGLAELAGPIRQIEDALTGLGQDRPVAVLRECGKTIAEFTLDGYRPRQADFEEVARTLSGLGFFIERLDHGPADIDAILHPPAAAETAPAPSVEAEMAAAARMTRTLVGALREKPEDEALRGEIKQGLETLREDARLVDDAAIEAQAIAAIDALTSARPGGVEEAVARIAPAAPPAPSPDAVRLAGASGEEIDAELLAIFIEEAHEVLAAIGELHPRLLAQPHDRETLTTVRRGFHTLKGSGRMVGLAELGEAAWAVEQVLNRWLRQELDVTPELAAMVADAHALFRDWVARLEAGGGARDASALLAVCERMKSGEPRLAGAKGRQAHLRDDLDPQLLQSFLEEGPELMRRIGAELRAWRAQPLDTAIADQVKRLLHTFKGDARMAGAMGLGELVHGMETRIGQAAEITPAFLDDFDAAFDRAAALFEGLHHREAEAAPVAVEAPSEPGPTAEAPARAQLRVRADVVDRLINEAGEMSIARGRIEGEMRALKSSLLELTENVIRLRGQLREIEIQAESRMQSGQALVAERNAQFDPLEFDRFTRFQELTRMMAESVNDVATVQYGLLHGLDRADAAIAAQARLNRELSQSLMGVRMVPFNAIADRLHRIVRRTAKELGKRASLDIRGGQTELDRSVLESMTGPLEHLLRNAVTHGLETPEQRAAAGKPAAGEIALGVTQEGGEVQIALADDGRGLDLDRIRARAVERGLAGADADERQLTQLIFLSGFSTAEEVTELSGRGVGLDVVKNETARLGGRIEVVSTAGRGCLFRIVLPLTLAVAQAVLVRSGGRTYAVPSPMVEQASELKPDAIAGIRAEGGVEWLGNRYPWHYLPRLLGDLRAEPQPQRRRWLLLMHSGGQRAAIEVDDMAGNQEIVVKNAGPQLARLVGITGATVLADGEIVLILNPVALAGRKIKASPASAEAPPATAAGTVMVVDDSLTVRKIAGRLLAREGYHVLTARDGVDALEQLTDTVPDAMLVDIEMPHMDGFDLTRNVRADPRLKEVPIVMITSRIADKHRTYAMEIGVNHYLGKPYDEDELLGLIAGYARKPSR